jgi:hypothetical protein
MARSFLFRTAPRELANKEIDMLTLLIALIVLLVLFGGVGYGYRDRWGGYYTGGTSLLGLIVVVLLVLWLIGALR